MCIGNLQEEDRVCKPCAQTYRRFFMQHLAKLEYPGTLENASLFSNKVDFYSLKITA